MMSTQQSTNLKQDKPNSLFSSDIPSLEEKGIAEPTKMYQSATNSPFINRLDQNITTSQQIKVIHKITGTLPKVIMFNDGVDDYYGIELTIPMSTISNLPDDTYPCIFGHIVDDFKVVQVPGTVWNIDGGVTAPIIESLVDVTIPNRNPPPNGTYATVTQNIVIKYFSYNGVLPSKDVPVTYTIYFAIPVDY